MDPLISGPDHPRWTDTQFLALAQHKQEAAMPTMDQFNEMARKLAAIGKGVWWMGYQGDVEKAIAAELHAAHAAGKAEGCDKSTIPEGYMLVPIVLPPGIVTQATPAVEVLDKPGNMVERTWRLLISALQAKGH